MNLSIPLRSAALLVLLSACASARSTMPTTTNPPVVTTAPATSPSAAPRGGAPAARDSAPANWHRLDLEQDGVLGVGSERALRELLAGRQPSRRVIVAVIDGGVDTAHALLEPNLWRNPRETAGNGRDDDGNSYVDDVFGWNYAGARTGESIHHDTFELTRLYAACKGLPAGRGIARPDAGTCATLATAYGRKRDEIGGTLGQIAGISAALERASAVLRQALRTDSLTVERVRALSPANGQVTEARRIFLQLAENGLTESEVAEARTAYEAQFRFGLDTMFNPRAALGADTAAAPQRPYGNRDATGPDASHGTHVAGIIGARRDRGGDVQGIASSVSIMAIRAVPNGDERDPDVASAIRYAADNGAHIINMSFGKAYSPQKASVDSAVRYAESKGVLFVHAAGNDGEDIDANPSFPSPVLGTDRARAWLEVGASSWKGGADIPANFSNYGRQRVDIFAPGVDILSTVPNGKVDKESGTSMAAPVVSGVAALLMSYFPGLSAVDVKDLLIASARPLGNVNVAGPGGAGTVRFSALSRTGGVVDAYAAVKAALARVPQP